jgi:hypothetical protein
MYSSFDGWGAFSVIFLSDFTGSIPTLCAFLQPYVNRDGGLGGP